MGELLGFLLTIVSVVASWKIYKKMGREGWEALIPIYNSYILFKVLYGNGWRFLLVLIPFYNIYLVFKVCIDLAKAFNKDGAFGVGLVFLPFIFDCILAFDNSIYMDGTFANNEQDIIDDAANFFDNIHDQVSNSNASNEEKLKELKNLYDEGLLTLEEYEAKRKNIINKI